MHDVITMRITRTRVEGGRSPLLPTKRSEKANDYAYLRKGRGAGRGGYPPYYPYLAGAGCMAMVVGVARGEREGEAGKRRTGEGDVSRGRWSAGLPWPATRAGSPRTPPAWPR